MGLGISLPWMLAWLAAAVVPILLAWMAVRRPRLVPWAATELVAAAARRQHLTRGGIPLPLTIVRALLLACAALAAARPFVASKAGTPAASSGTRLVAGSATERIEIITAAPADDAGLAVRGAVEALARANPSPPTVDLVTLPAAAVSSTAGRTLLVLCDAAVPTATDAARLGDAVAGGAALLICIGPASTAGDERPRLSSWLDTLAGIAVEGRVDFPDTPLEVAAELAAGFAGGADSSAADFVTLPGPGVAAAADLTVRTAKTEGVDAVTVLARTTAGRRPLLVTRRHGRGIVCVSALPLSLRSTATDAAEPRPWSDLAAWPVFVPLLDRLVAHLLAASQTGGHEMPRSDATAVGAVPAARVSPATPLPLGPLLAAAACVLAVVDWLLSARATGSAAGSGLAVRQRAGHAATLVGLVGVLTSLIVLTPPTPSPSVDRPSGDRPRPVAIVIDTSPSMAGVAASDPSDGQGRSRLESAIAALTAASDGSSPLDRIARERPVTLFTSATRGESLGDYGRNVTAADLRSLEAAPPAAHATRLGDVIEGMLADTARDAAPAAIVVVSDAAITGGVSWAGAARAAAERSVPLVAVPVAGGEADDGGGTLPPGFRITAITAPPLCNTAESVTIDVVAEAAAGRGPVPISLFASTAALEAGGAAGRLPKAESGKPKAGSGEPIATGTLALEPAAGPTIQTHRRFAARLTVPPHGFQDAGDATVGSALLSPLLTVDATANSEPRAVAAATTIGLTVSDSPIRVLFVETVPRYEWRFLEQLVSASRGFESQTCMLTPVGGAGLRPGAALPRSAAEWNWFDVVVLGDVDDGSAGDAPAADRQQAWSSLRDAAATEGIGIAWIPGRRWQEGHGGGPGWLPATPAAAAPGLLTAPFDVRVLPGGRSSDWLPGGVARPASSGDGVLAAFHPEVFAVMRPVSLRPTARVLATATAVERGGATAGESHPAVIVDRLGEATVLGCLCETWRWRRGHESDWEHTWRQMLARLAEPHLRGRLFAATIDVRPLAPEAGDRVRIDVVPARSTTDLAGWRVELTAAASAEGAGGAATPQAFPLPDRLGPGLTATVVVDGLAAGAYTLRLVPPASAATEPPGVPSPPVVRDIVVSEPLLEAPGGPVDSGPFEAAARATGGSVVPLREIAVLPDAIAAAVAAADGRSRSPQDRTSTPRGWSIATAMAHLLMLAVVAAAVTAWWQPHAAPREVS